MSARFAPIWNCFIYFSLWGDSAADLVCDATKRAAVLPQARSRQTHHACTKTEFPPEQHNPRTPEIDLDQSLAIPTWAPISEIAAAQKSINKPLTR
jgi:hypothetical protein